MPGFNPNNTNPDFVAESKKWRNIALMLMNRIAVQIDVEDLPWTANGSFDIDEFIKRYNTYMKQQKKKQFIRSLFRPETFEN